MTDEPRKLKAVAKEGIERREREHNHRLAAAKTQNAKAVAADTMESIKRVQQHFGLEINSGPLPTCDVCSGGYTVDTAFAGLELCPEHLKQTAACVAERVLRNVIPQDHHTAHPSQLRPDLQKWDATQHIGLYLFGEVGAGKSHDACALMKRAFMKRYSTSNFPSVSYINIPILIVDTLAAFSKKRDPSPPWDAATKAEILVVDDIGLEEPKGWILTKLYALIEYRLQNRKLTIFTSNLDLDELADHLNMPQLASRIAKMTYQISYVGLPDLRIKNAPTL